MNIIRISYTVAGYSISFYLLVVVKRVIMVLGWAFGLQILFLWLNGIDLLGKRREQVFLYIA